MTEKRQAYLCLVLSIAATADGVTTVGMVLSMYALWLILFRSALKNGKGAE